MATIYEKGIDVSRYQGTIDWAAVAASGQQFAIVRVGSTDNNGVYVDRYFRSNVDGAHAAGMKVGAYYYTYAKTQDAVIKELNTFLPQLKAVQLEYPVFVDMEDSSFANLSRSQVTELTRYAMDILYQNGLYGGFYTYTYFATNYIDTAALADYPLWIADYRGYVGYQGGYTMWQFSSTGQVSGITGNVDLDYSYVDFLPFIQQGGFNGYTPTGPVLVPLENQLLEVFSERCEYFNSPDVNDVVGYLPLGSYTAVAMSERAFGGFTWVTFLLDGQEYWTALLADRCRLVEGEIDGGDGGDCEECRQQLAEANGRIEAARLLLADALEALEGES